MGKTKYDKIKAGSTEAVGSDVEEEEVKESDDEHLGILKQSISYIPEELEQDATVGLVSNQDFSERFAQQTRSRQLCLCKVFFTICALLISLYTVIILFDVFPIKEGQSYLHNHTAPKHYTPGSHQGTQVSTNDGSIPTLTPTGGPVSHPSELITVTPTGGPVPLVSSAEEEETPTITPTGGPVSSVKIEGGRIYPGLPYGSPGPLTHTPTGGPVSLPEGSTLEDEGMESPTVDATTAMTDTVEEVDILDPFSLAQIDPKRMDFWRKVNSELVDVTKKVLHENPVKHGGWSWLGKWKQVRTEFCLKKNKEEAKKFGEAAFEAPPTDISSNHFLGFDLQKAIKHVENTIADLCAYYKPLGKECPLSTALLPSLTGTYAKSFPDRVDVKTKQERKAFATSLRIHAWRFARKIVYREPLKIGVLGTSVLAGMDNCFRTSYGPGLEKDLRHLMKPVIDVEVRTSAQNGDGPPMYSSMVCSDAVFNLDEVDSVHMYWNMGPHMTPQTHELVIRSWMSRKKMVFPLYLREQSFLHDKMPYYMAGFVDRSSEKDNFPVVVDNATQYMTFPWWHGPRAHWGMIGDGRCHMQTRENIQAIFKQNWHPGPMENQMYRDMTTFFYAQAYLEALKDVKEAINSGSQTLEALQSRWPTHQPPGIGLPPPQHSGKGCVEDKACEDTFSLHGFCATAQEASWNGQYNLTAWRDHSPYKGVNDTVGTWIVHRIKRPSRIGAAREREKGEEAKDPTCNGHSDRVVTYLAKGEPGGWITFRVPRVKNFKGQVIICTVRSSARHAQEFFIKINGNDVKTVARAEPGGILEGSARACRRVVKDAPKDTEYISISIASSSKGFGILSLILI